MDWNHLKPMMLWFLSRGKSSNISTHCWAHGHAYRTPPVLLATKTSKWQWSSYLDTTSLYNISNTWRPSFPILIISVLSSQVSRRNEPHRPGQQETDRHPMIVRCNLHRLRKKDKRVGGWTKARNCRLGSRSVRRLRPKRICPVALAGVFCTGNVPGPVRKTKLTQCKIWVESSEYGRTWCKQTAWSSRKHERRENTSVREPHRNNRCKNVPWRRARSLALPLGWRKTNCLVARFAIVARIFQIILSPCIVWKVHYCGKKSWGDNFFCPKNVCVKESEQFFWKKLAFLHVPKESDRWLNP